MLAIDFVEESYSCIPLVEDDGLLGTIIFDDVVLIPNGGILSNLALAISSTPPEDGLAHYFISLIMMLLKYYSNSFL